MNLRSGGLDLSTLRNGGAASTPLRGAITYAAGTTGAIGTTTLFTVTGDVLLTSMSAKATTSLTSGGVPTFDLGVVGNTTKFGATFPNVTGWTTGKWADPFTPDYQTAVAIDMITAAGAPAAGYKAISANIVQTIAAATITGGVVRWYLQYIPLSGDGAIALHSNLVAF